MEKNTPNQRTCCNDGSRTINTAAPLINEVSGNESKDNLDICAVPVGVGKLRMIKSRLLQYTYTPLPFQPIPKTTPTIFLSLSFTILQSNKTLTCFNNNNNNNNNKRKKERQKEKITCLSSFVRDFIKSFKLFPGHFNHEVWLQTGKVSCGT